MSRPVPLHRIAVRRLLLIGAFGIAMAAGLLIPFPVTGRGWNELFNLAHAPAFALLTLVIAGTLDPSSIGLPTRFHTLLPITVRRAILLSAATALTGVGAELLQQSFHRSASLTDAVANGIGCLFALLWIASFIGSAKRRSMIRGVCVCLLIVGMWRPLAELHDWRLQLQQFPLLSSLERPRELSVWYATDAELSRSQEWSIDGKWSLRIGLQPAAYSGAVLEWPAPDWAQHQRLHLDLFNAGRDQVVVTVKVSDRLHARSNFDPTDRFEKLVPIAAGQHKVFEAEILEIAAAPATREMRMSEIDRIELFIVGNTSSGVLFVDNVRLLQD